MIDLKELAGRRYRITLDESAKLDTVRENRPWYYRIPCKYGHVYVHGEDMLGAWTDRRLMIRKLTEVEGVKVHQRGDREVTVIFSPECLNAVTELLRARKRPQLSPETRERLVAMMRDPRFLSRKDEPHDPRSDDDVENDPDVDLDPGIAPRSI